MGFFSWLMGDDAVSDDAASYDESGQKTVVYLRSLKVPAQHWEDVVRYDAWGQPYTKYGRGHGASYGEISLLPDGRTGETWLYGTEWRHKSGPEVRFTPKPKSPFPTGEA